jgi:hypothetical protein
VIAWRRVLMMLDNGRGIAPVDRGRWRNIILIFDSRLQRIGWTPSCEGVIVTWRIGISILCIVRTVRSRLIKAAIMASAWPQRFNTELRFLVGILHLGIAVGRRGMYITIAIRVLSRDDRGGKGMRELIVL